MNSPTPAQLGYRMPRSEEHTSELQPPCNLLCRLLLEKRTNRFPAVQTRDPDHSAFCSRIPRKTFVRNPEASLKRGVARRIYLPRCNSRANPTIAVLLP